MDGRAFSYRGGSYQDLFSERGCPYEILLSTKDLDEFIYHFLSEITRGFAQRWELGHRVPGQDSRRFWIAKHIELMTTLSPAWGHKTEKEYDELLKDYPYDDARG